MENSIISINSLKGSKSFSYEEALALIPLFNIITSKTKRQLNTLNSQLEYLKRDSEKAETIQTQINHELQSWSDKVRRLGAIPVSISKVHIPGTNERFLWEYPESKLQVIS